MENLVEIGAKEFGIEESKAQELTNGLSTILEERQSLAETYKEVIKLEVTAENIPVFRELRLKIRDNRTKGINVWHKVNKEFFLAGGRFVDAIKNREIAENERMEEKLLEGEKYFENLEKERLEKLQAERINAITPFVDDVTGLDLSAMDEDVWDAYFSTKKAKHEERLAEERRAEEKRIEEERLDKIEQDRRYEVARFIQFLEQQPDYRGMNDKQYKSLKTELLNKKKAYDKEQEEIKAENERLKREREAEVEKQRKLEAERKAKEEKELRERKAAEAKKEAGYQAQLKKEREAREKLEAERKAQKEAEEKAEAERKAEAARLAKAPVKEKLSKWVNSLDINTAGTNHELEKEIIEKFDSFKKWANFKIENL